MLEGYIGLSLELAHEVHYPAVDVLRSISRLADDVVTPEHSEGRRTVVRLVNAYRQVEDLLNIGAYAPGSNADYDLAIAVKPMLDQLLQQGRNEVRGRASFDTIRSQLGALQQQVEKTRAELTQTNKQRRSQGQRG